MRQVPLIRVGNISTHWYFRFVHNEIVTRNALSSTRRTWDFATFATDNRSGVGLCHEYAKLASQPPQFQCFMPGMKRLLILQLFGALVVAMAHAATNFDLATKATNELAVDLHRQLATGEDNLCVSPYSIQSALSMTFAGADGETRNEMAQLLHFTTDASAVAASFASLQHSLEEMSTKTAELAKKSKEFGGPSEPITLNVANRLFAQKDYDFRHDFLSLVKQNYG